MINPTALGEIAWDGMKAMCPQETRSWASLTDEQKGLWAAIALAVLGALDAANCPHCGQPLGDALADRLGPSA